MHAWSNTTQSVKHQSTLNVLDCFISCSYAATFCPINRDEHNEVDKVKQSKAWSEPRPNPKKKKVCYITLLFGIISPNQYASQPTPFMNLLAWYSVLQKQAYDPIHFRNGSQQLCLLLFKCMLLSKSRAAKSDDLKEQESFEKYYINKQNRICDSSLGM